MLRHKDINLRINPAYNKTNMVHTLFCADSDLNQEVIVSYGDIVYSREILDALISSRTDIAVTIDLDWEDYWRARNENPLNDAETLKLSSDSRIIEIGQKPRSIDDIEGQYMGLMKFSINGIKVIRKLYYQAVKTGYLGEKPVKDAYMTDLLQEIINLNIRIDAVPISGGWVEIDTVEDLKSKITTERILKIE